MRWAYDDWTGVQALRGLICLCSGCQLSTHLGFANVTARADQALTHLRAVTGMTDTEASRHVQASGVLWTWRFARVWTLDLNMLTDAEVTFARPETSADRTVAAERALRREQERTPAPIPAQHRTMNTLPLVECVAVAPAPDLKQNSVHNMWPRSWFTNVGTCVTPRTGNDSTA